jgi:hypothetical protein
LVSKKTLPGVDLFPIEDILRGSRTPQLAHLFDQLLAFAVAADLNAVLARHNALEILAKPQIELCYDFGGKAYR